MPSSIVHCRQSHKILTHTPCKLPFRQALLHQLVTSRGSQSTSAAAGWEAAPEQCLIAGAPKHAAIVARRYKAQQDMAVVCKRLQPYVMISIIAHPSAPELPPHRSLASIILQPLILQHLAGQWFQLAGPTSADACIPVPVATLPLRRGTVCNPSIHINVGADLCTHFVKSAARQRPASSKSKAISWATFSGFRGPIEGAYIPAVAGLPRRRRRRPLHPLQPGGQRQRGLLTPQQPPQALPAQQNLQQGV